MATLTSRLILALTDRVSGPARGISGTLARLQGQASRTSGAMLGGAFTGGAVRSLMAVGAGYVGVTRGIGGTVGAAMKFEEAFADVRKVVDGTPGQLAQIRHEILAMSKTIPTSAEGIAAIYAAAGQSNIPIRELSKFSEMVAKVSVAWETTESETSESLAKIKNQLNLDVDGIGLYADAINQLGNNTAAAAPDLVQFSRRVAANGEMFGFANTETLAFGSAMISAGAQSEVAATSFRNMGRALTIGQRATKSHSTAFKRLGLDAVKTAKSMQANALETTLDVIDRIAGLPEWERISIASALFGDEARALMPVISNSKELRRQLALVARESDYAGSSFEEYMVRAETSANALSILGNKMRATGIGIGDSWLPTIKELGLGIGDVLDTLEKRVGVLDQVKTAFSSFLSGFGYGGSGGLRQMMNDLGDLLFGEAFAGEMGAADERVIGLARISNTFRDIGRDFASFSADIKSGNVGEALGHVGDALSKMSGSMTVGGALALGLAGRAMLGVAAGVAALALSKTGQLFITAYAIGTLIDAVKGAESLSEFAASLSQLSAFDWTVLAGGLGLIGTKIWRIARGLRAIAGAGGVEAVTNASRGGKPSPSAAAGKAGWLGLFGRAGGMLGGLALAGWGVSAYGPQAAGRARAAKPGEPLDLLGIDPSESRAERLARLKSRRPHSSGPPTRGRRDRGERERASALDGYLGEMPQNGSGFNWKKFLLGAAAEPGFSMRDHLKIDAGIGGKNGPQDVSLVGAPPVTIEAPVETRPTGTQDVRVTNPMPAPVVNITINATTNASPADIGAAASAALSRELNALSSGAYSDGAN